MGIHRWQQEFDHQAKEDNRVILEALADISKRQDLLMEVVTMQQQATGGVNPMRDVMDMMQTNLSSMEIGDPQHSSLQRNLHYFQQQSGDLLPEMELKRGEVRRLGRVSLRLVVMNILLIISARCRRFKCNGHLGGRIPGRRESVHQDDACGSQ
jgi:hypothetical protein